MAVHGRRGADTRLTGHSPDSGMRVSRRRSVPSSTSDKGVCQRAAAIVLLAIACS
jgi:hypothetical protein